MQKKWVFPEKIDNRTVSDLASKLNAPKVIAEILINRGIDSNEEAKRFFNPKLSDLNDPFLMKNMKNAVDRIQEALKNREKIMIYGDYDVDGITACSLLYIYFREMTDQVFFFIPERLKDGYGFSMHGVEEAKKLGISLLITVDCGITSIEEVRASREFGMDVIVTDHHQPGTELPDALAILNPLQVDCEYPFKGLSGVGVAFKLVHAINMVIGRDMNHLMQYADLVAIGSAADVVPLVDENRILVRAGLERINDRKNIGLNALLSVALLKNSFIGTGQILFGIAPRINAVGRLGSAERAVNLFTANEMSKAYEIAHVLEQENQQRKSIEEETFNEAMQLAESEFESGLKEPLVLYKDGWHPGVIGIVASRLVEKFFRPVVMVAFEEGVGKGSVRSVPDFDVYDALKNCGQYLKEYGGHKLAAGLSVDEKNIVDFKKAFKTITRETLTDEILIPKLSIEAIITLDKIDARLYEILRHFAPFGPQNTRPVFIIKGAQVAGNPTIVGKNHLKFNVSQNGSTMPAIGFNMGNRINEVEKFRNKLEIAFVVDENTWRGTTTLQLQVKDIRENILDN
ncbi:single-stranded-DNA-specific exonuclease RecJ [candidate division KSB1 bacterium]